jgi:PAS domain S-box-containing protein
MNFKSPKFQGNESGWLRIVEAAPMAVVVVDESNTIVWMNATAYTLFKVSTESTTDDAKWDSLVFSLESDGTEPCDFLESNERDSMGPFKAFITRSNTRVEVNVMKVQFAKSYACCYLIPDPSDEPIFNCSLDAVIQADLDKNIIGWNVAAENTFGYSEKEVIGKPLSTIFPRRNSRGENDVYQLLLHHKGAVVNRMVGITGHRKDGMSHSLNSS